jgi:hypothetical protein
MSNLISIRDGINKSEYIQHPQICPNDDADNKKSEEYCHPFYCIHLVVNNPNKEIK